MILNFFSLSYDCCTAQKLEFNKSQRRSGQYLRIEIHVRTAELRADDL